MSGLEGKTVLITGAARGIGAETARVLVARGARVSLVGLEPERLEALAGELGAGSLAFEADVTDAAALEAAVAATVAETGGIDAVVANAGIAYYGSVGGGDSSGWKRCVDVNLVGAYLSVRAALPHVIERRGYVLIVCSVASLTTVPGISAYGASKAGAEALANTLRLEVARRGVAVGTAHPSWIDTDMVRDAERELATFRGLRSKLPWPVRSTTSVQVCARALVDGIRRRRRRTFVPRSVALLHWGRLLLNSRLATPIGSRVAASALPSLDAEVAELGRATSARTEV